MATVSLLVLAACNPAEPNAVGDANLASIVMSPTTASLESFGETVTVLATPRDASGRTLSARTFVWASSRPSVASVDMGGVV